VRGFVFAVVFLAVTSGQALACFTGGNAAQDQTVDHPMQVKSGGSCAYNVRSLGPIERVVLTKRPSVGIVDLSGPHVRYRAKAGYVGSDEFIVTVHARSLVDKPYVWSTRVHVTVTR
jgi:hypothetical protein